MFIKTSLTLLPTFVYFLNLSSIKEELCLVIKYCIKVIFNFVEIKCYISFDHLPDKNNNAMFKIVNRSFIMIFGICLIFHLIKK